MKLEHMPRARALADKFAELDRMRDVLAVDGGAPVVWKFWIDGASFVPSDVIDQAEVRRVIAAVLMHVRLQTVNELAELGVEVEP